MYHVKPGSGPSLWNIVGGIIGVVFTIFWIIPAGAKNASWVSVAFGVLMLLLFIGWIAYNGFNAFSDNRVSTFDITTDREEPDPVARIAKSVKGGEATGDQELPTGTRKFPGDFCPFCGENAGASFQFCPKCGKGI